MADPGSSPVARRPPSCEVSTRTPDSIPSSIQGTTLSLPSAFRPVLIASLVAPALAAPASGEPPFSEAPLPHYLLRQARGEITVDGRLDEFDWAAASQINAFTRILNDYGRITSPTRARMLWNDEGLYIAFACRDGNMWALFTEEDDPMWSEEVVEVFIDPDGDGLDYLELEVNPLNAVVDLHIGRVHPDWVSDKDWDILGLETAVQVEGTVNDSTDVDRGWTVEISIPWAAFEPAIAGARETPGRRPLAAEPLPHRAPRRLRGPDPSARAGTEGATAC